MAVRTEGALLPEFSAELEEIRKYGISVELLYKIIQKHQPNALYNKQLYNRYRAIYGSVPIFQREPMYEEEENPINNTINNDFFGEIVDFKTGYFAGNPIAYGYSESKESEKTTGSKEAVEKAIKVLTDFTTRNNMYGVDMETTKFASIYGYAGRLFYIDKEGNERVMPVHGFETIILSDTDISEPEYAIRYYTVNDIDGKMLWIVDFYDNTNIKTYKGELTALEFVEEKRHYFDYCPLQGIANNKEMLGDAEKVLALIDDYDKVLSDNSNEIEAFVHAYLVFENLYINEEEIGKGQKSGAFVFNNTGTQQGKAYFLTKNINDAFTEHHLQRLEDNIYRFSRTPNLADETFGSASGVSLKFKLHGLETKCGMFEAKMMDAAQYMFKVLASAWNKKAIAFDPLQATLEFKRNFPLDNEGEAKAMQGYKAVGMPMRWILEKAANIDDPNYVLDMIEEEQQNAMSLYEDMAAMNAGNQGAGKKEETEPNNKEDE